MMEFATALLLFAAQYPPAWVLAIVVAAVLCYRLPEILQLWRRPGRRRPHGR